MKKTLILAIALGMALGLAGCAAGGARRSADGTNGDAAKRESASARAESGEKLEIVTTIFPAYDFARNVAGDRANVTMLLPPGAESHSYEPAPQDIIKIQNADMFIYVGGDSDTWVTGILDAMDQSGLTVLSMMDMVNVVEEEIKEGMEGDHGHDHSHDDFGPEDVQDRSLAEWEGDWTSIHLAKDDPAFDAYYAAKAEEVEMSPAEAREKYAEHWDSDYSGIRIEGGKVTFMGEGDEISAEYSANGYEVIEVSDGVHRVWYHYEADAPGAPKHVIISDHGYKPAEHHDEHDGHEEHEGHLVHYHLKYGDGSVQELAAQSEWAPTYFPAGSSASEQAEVMIEHLDDHSHKGVYDEHVWTSPKNAISIVKALAGSLSAMDGDGEESYQANSAAYVAELKSLDRTFEDVVANGSRKTLIFGDRFPFRYFVESYGLDYYAAFPGCSTDTEASAQTVAFLIDKVKAEQIPVVLHIEFSNGRMADSICESTGAQKRLLHSAHNVSRDEIAAGATYLDLMKQNVETLKEALS